jgi:hypothetical protein
MLSLSLMFPPLRPLIFLRKSFLVSGKEAYMQLDDIITLTVTLLFHTFCFSDTVSRRVSRWISSKMVVAATCLS